MKRQDETTGSQSLLWQLRQVLWMTEAVTSDARSLHSAGHTFGRSSTFIIETALCLPFGRMLLHSLPYDRLD